MHLKKLEIENFRRIKKASIEFSPTAFIVGANNASKSSIIAAVEALLTLDKEKITQADIQEEADGNRAPHTMITGWFSDVGSEVSNSRGFKGRVINNEFVYRKTLLATNNKPKIETQEYPSKLKSEFKAAKTYNDLRKISG